jgi:hypothetical protein
MGFQLAREPYIKVERTHVAFLIPETLAHPAIAGRARTPSWALFMVMNGGK